MITRPLDLARRLRPEPRNFDWLFYVNVGLLALFFTLFGSQLVLAPGVNVDFRLPEVVGADAGAKPTTHVLTIESSGLILTNDGRRKLEELEGWLSEKAKSVKEPILLIRGNEKGAMETFVSISSTAKRVGFREVLWAAAEPTGRTDRGDR